MDELNPTESHPHSKGEGSEWYGPAGLMKKVAGVEALTEPLKNHYDLRKLVVDSQGSRFRDCLDLRLR